MRGLVVIAIAVIGCASEPAVVKDPPPALPGGGSAVLGAGDAGAGAGSAAAEVAACPVCPVCSICEPDADTKSAAPHDVMTLTRVTFADLPGWADDRHGEAVPSFLRSCERLAKLADTAPVGHDGHGGSARQWRKACAAAAKLKAGDHAAARAMFEAEFVPHQAAGKAGVDGKLTGYFVQELRASKQQGGTYQYPIYGRPKDLVMVDLSKHIRDARARRIWGRLDDKGEVVPHYTRAEIRKGVLAGQGLELMYADDPVDVLFAHIEGSAKAKLPDGSVVWLEFSGKNGRAYRGVGGVLKGMGELEAPGSGTMQGIRAWFAANPKRFDEVVDQVHSFVFFSESKHPGAVGSQMVILTGKRSMAIDRAFIAQSTPIWVETRAPVPGKPGTVPWRQLLIAQDTGGGILGAVRGDIYWGDDADAAEIGGRMGGAGRYWLLLPKGVTK
ncbi:MAG: murein transglycosylase A [Deltaproteobacteria bacterium]|nr:murein transglycosylase A [Deltaproteobacteria bacterium]